jgi:hypothetical protein
MNQPRDRLIKQLTADLPSVSVVRAGTATTALWLGFSTVLVALLTLAVQPFRPGFEEQLLEVPRFALETVIGVIAIALTGTAGLKSAIPGSNAPGLTRWAVAATALWLSSYVAGLYIPTLESTMVGKRPHCALETLLYSAPALVVGIWIAGRRYVLNWPRTAVTIAVTAGGIPAFLMQLACMYGARHILLTHFAPVLLVATLGLFIGLILQHRSNHP